MVNHRIRVCFSLALCLLLGFVATSTGTTVERLTLEDLTHRAGSIVQGTIRSSQVHWDSRRRLILTTTSVEISEAIKGQPARILQITTVGGQIGSSALYVAGMPAFRPGETAILFTEQSGPFVTVLGLNQGKFSVVNGEAENSVSELAFPDGKTAHAYKMPVATLKSRIQEILKQGK